MRKYLILLMMLMAIFLTGQVFAGGVNEEATRETYETRGFPNRDDWLYEFNSVANDVVKYSKRLVEGTSWTPDFDKDNFDNACIKYKVLLDMAVELAYINDDTRKQQVAKAETERKKVAEYLASQSSGLGLE